MTGVQGTGLAAAASSVGELLRAALVAKLAVDLEDPVLARRAARLAAGHAQVLSRLDFPAHSKEDDDVLSEPDVQPDVQLPDVGDLLALRHSSRDPLAFVTTLTRLPSRAELHADAAAPKKIMRRDLDPRPVRPPLSPRPEKIDLAPPAGGL